MLYRLFLSCLFSILCIVNTCSAACPITHAVLAKKFWEYYPKYNEEEKSAFMVGTLFPDIRYIDACEREFTHFPNVTLDDVLNAPTPFSAGMLFHSYVDLHRENFVVENKLYEYIAHLDSPRPTTLLKVVEDEHYYNSATLQYCRNCLKNNLDEELQQGIDKDKVDEWHFVVTNWFSYMPSTILYYLSIRKMSVLDINAEEVGIMYQHHHQLISDPFMQNYTKNLMIYFEELFAQK